MNEVRKMERVVKEVMQEQELRRHLSDGALIRHHDRRLDDTELRWHIERHLELCTSCRERFEAVTHIHLSEEELLDYHDGQVSNPHTLARIRAHLKTERCPLCTSWLAEFQQAEDEAATFYEEQGNQ